MVLNGSNPLNVDPPETETDFLSDFNASVIDFVEEVIHFQEILEEVEATNMLAEQLINLVSMCYKPRSEQVYNYSGKAN